jgi:sugar lactone lactonase YvrE
MDAILELPPNLPVHRAAPLQPVPHRTIAEWPVGTFLENLAMLDDGAIAVSVLFEARIDRVTPGGERSILHRLEAPVTGLAVMGRYLFAAVGEPGQHSAALWRLDPDSGEAQRWMTLDGVTFANGVTPFDAHRLLIAESWTGQLILADIGRKTTSVWVADERLTRAPGIDFLPGANGVKRFRDSVMVSSNGRALLLRVAVKRDGSAGPVETVAEHLRVDDLAFDQSGNAYLCTHIGHSLDRLTPRGQRVSLGGVGEGLAGSTACAFGRHGVERRALYVTTTGGIVSPPGGILQPAKLVRLEVDAVGHDLASVEHEEPR